MCVKRWDEIILESFPEKFGNFWGMEGDQSVKSLEEGNEEMDWRWPVGTAL